MHIWRFCKSNLNKTWKKEVEWNHSTYETKPLMKPSAGQNTQTQEGKISTSFWWSALYSYLHQYLTQETLYIKYIKNIASVNERVLSTRWPAVYSILQLLWWFCFFKELIFALKVALFSRRRNKQPERAQIYTRLLCKAFQTPGGNWLKGKRLAFPHVFSINLRRR